MSKFVALLNEKTHSKWESSGSELSFKVYNLLKQIYNTIQSVNQNNIKIIYYTTEREQFKNDNILLFECQDVYVRMKRKSNNSMKSYIYRQKPNKFSFRKKYQKTLKMYDNTSFLKKSYVKY